MRWLFLLLVLLVACTPSVNDGSTPSALTVSAASDLIPAFERVGALFSSETGIAVTFNFGSSGQLAQQIEQGAPVDVFASASRDYIDELTRSGLIIPDTVTAYALGRITIWTRSDSILQLTGLNDLDNPAVKRIAIANPAHAPYGAAAREALKNAGIWDQVQDKLVFGNSVSQTLQMAETNSVDAAIVALSLSISTDGAWVLIPDMTHNPIEQVIGVVRTTKDEQAARQFIAFVKSESGTAILKDFGFVIPEADS